MSIIQPTLTQEQQTEITNYINSYRTKNQAPPLIWDNTIATASQEWSYNLANTNTFQHSNNPLYGENLTFLQGYGTDVMTLLKKSVDDWYNEILSYNFNNPRFSEATGHFTCLVWVSSTNYGMGISINNDTNAVDIVLNTSPPGNVIGQFQQNVLPVIGSIPVITPAPIPAPMPTPIPTPFPIINPYPKSTKIYYIINGLNSIIHELQTKKRKNVLILSVNNLIDQILNMQTPNNNVINELYNLINMIQNKKSKNDIINNINNIIYDLLIV
jgi:hypothetical protein